MATQQYSDYDPYDRFNPHNVDSRPYIGPEGSHTQQTFESYSDYPQQPMDIPRHQAQPWNQYPPSLHTTGSSIHAPSTYDERVPLKDANDGLLPPIPPLGGGRGKPKGLKRSTIILIVVAAVIIIAAAVVVPVYFFVIKPKTDSSDARGNAGGASGTATARPSSTSTATKPDAPQRVITGGDNSEVTLEDGSKFRYRNAFGGYWVHDPLDPFNDGARPNSWTPPLNETWKWGVNHVYGVNLGGLFVLEPFITPAIFQKYPGSEDEFTLTALMKAAGTLETEMEEHYKTFITEKDIADIASAGLNWLRVPIGFWMVESYDNEPFLERVSWTYFLKIVDWARKYGLRIYLDLHALPGGQNALNHSARKEYLALLRGPMGLANAQRALYYLRVLTQFVSQPEYKSVIQMIGLINEPQTQVVGERIPMDVLQNFYLEAYRIIREITGFGEGNGPYIAVGDGFRSALEWAGMMPGADRFMMDIHPYVAFDDGAPRTGLLTAPAEDGELGGIWPKLACDRWGVYFNESKRQVGVTVGGEFSAAVNDCGLFMRAVGVDSTHPQCALYNAWETWTPEWKKGLENFVMASFDAIGDWFFWTWKIGPSAAGRVETPMWSYQLGLENGWIPRNPRTALGKCESLGAESAPFDGNFQPHQTGAVAQPVIAAAYSAQHPWPPTALPEVDVPISFLPTYVTSGVPITMPPATYTSAPASKTSGVDGWFNDNDKVGAVGPGTGCVYPDQYTVSAFAVAPTQAFTCGA